MNTLVINQNQNVEQINNRIVKGYEIYKSGLVNEVLTDRLEKAYVVGLNKRIVSEIDSVNGIYHCDCPDFEFRDFEACKHIFAVQFKNGA